MDLESLFQSRQTISRGITNQAQLYREQLMELIKEPVQNQSLTASPDMWTDRYRQLSYLGVTVTYVDLHLCFRKFTLCCRSFPVELAKTGENVSKVLKEELSQYGIERFDAVYWVSDRGSNFIRCFNLNMVDPIFCFAHRIHNILTITFINKKIDGHFNDEDIEDIPDNLGQEEFVGDEYMTLGAKRVFLTINHTKTLVRYVKQANLNELIVKLGGEETTTLKQSVVTRWLSLFGCVESVYSNYDAILLVLEIRRTTKYINDLTKYNLIDLLLLLAPLNAALQAIQTDEYIFEISVIGKKKYPLIFQSSFATDYLLFESGGVEFFRQRIHAKLIEMFTFDDRHYMAMCLHPALREMDDVSNQIKNICYGNIRKYLREKQMDAVDTTKSRVSSSSKKRKLLHRFLDEGEDDENEETQEQTSFDQNSIHVDHDVVDLTRKPGIERRRSSFASSISTEFSYRTNYQALKPDELDEYLEADLPSEIVNENPLQFWSSELASSKFPVLKCFARKLFSIPATSSGTERLFSYSGIILNNRRQTITSSSG
ncbi:unnamed protein product [Rotaria magnacalcarata]|uniref:HAT C-terminal dimerisation domain-containing protein n=6 Tax=Rotaria magnacalcarata TaxID=392030 RepID=A0A816ZTF4_9BILA|nr:unnamed protein product [Rotaria magnacalcarata]CAF4246590.1 unnamed protein product [Rotaria magnacalcarata]